MTHLNVESNTQTEHKNELKRTHNSRLLAKTNKGRGRITERSFVSDDEEEEEEEIFPISLIQRQGNCRKFDR